MATLIDPTVEKLSRRIPTQCLFSLDPSIDALECLNELLMHHEIRVRFYGQAGGWQDMQWLEHISNVEHLYILNNNIAHPVESLARLRDLKRLKSVSIAGLVDSQVDFTPLEELPKLQFLGIDAKDKTHWNLATAPG